MNWGEAMALLLLGFLTGLMGALILFRRTYDMETHDEVAALRQEMSRLRKEVKKDTTGLRKDLSGLRDDFRIAFGVENEPDAAAK